MRKNGPIERRWKHRMFVKMMIGLACIGLTFLFFYVFPFNMTASMPFGVYMRLPLYGNIHEGDYVEITNPLATGMYGVYVSSGMVKKVDHITDDGLYYVLGEHEYSYDSRYFGAIGPEYIRHRLKPVWTFRDIPECLRYKE